MSTDTLTGLIGDRDAGVPRGITSVCSAHELVIEAALLQAAEDGTEALIEATCNQVNQDGGYTGMTPAGFRDFVFAIAERVGFPRARIILGGDHLGPNPWKHLPAEAAMAKAGDMIAAYAEAGFEKLHLDASMGCHGEPAALADEVIAGRAVRLVLRAEAASGIKPVYIIGTEIPTPGGSTDGLDHLHPTRPQDVLTTYEIHRKAFSQEAPAAWPRVIAIVVQPGVEFGHEDVAIYLPEKAVALSASLAQMPGLVFEAHSTDYQPEAALRRLVEDGFPILKVGPGLTFALREAVYGLDAIAAVLLPDSPRVPAAMEAVMLSQPANWQSYYPGTPDQQRVLRHYSYSDRIRYYWPAAAARKAVDDLLTALDTVSIPETLISQFLPRLYERILNRELKSDPRTLLIEAVRDILRIYSRASAAGPTSFA